jgi:glycosyltransferase involved in cell wall biosynthesis
MISAVVICRNARPFLETCLASIRAQTLPVGEIIAVDGDSDDGTAEWLREQPDVRLVRQGGRGLANARNRGIESAAGDFLAFLDADDAWTPDKLARQAKALAEAPDLQAVTGHLVKSDAPGQRWVAMTPGGFLFRRSVFEEFGLFSENLRVAADHAWLLQATRRGLRYAILPDVVLHKTVHDAALSVSHKKEYRTELMTLLRRP